jgi:hypothetical protein
MSSFMERFDAMDRALVEHGFPATSPWWRETLARFYASGKRTLVLRVGRRGGKSSTLVRVGVAEALFGDHRIPAGDTGVVGFVSVSRDESASRLRTVESILRALGVGFRRAGDAVELEGRPIVFRTFTASIAGVSGFTSIAFFGDELAKWRDHETGANPAGEVIGSATPTIATMPHARMFLSSSAFGIEDYHFQRFEQGDGPAQMVAFAPTWVANPTISEQQTRELESDDRTWRREFAGIPQGSVSAAFDPDHVARAFEHPEPPFGAKITPPIVAIDASSGHHDAFTWAAAFWYRPRVGQPLAHTSPLADSAGNTIVGWYEQTHDGEFIEEDGWFRVTPLGRMMLRPRLYFSSFGAVEGEFFGDVSMEQIVAQISDVYHHFGARVVTGDQHGDWGLSTLFRRYGCRYAPIPLNNANKAAAVVRLRRLLADGQIAFLARDEKLEKELITYKEIIRATGTISYSGKQSKRTDDRVGAMIAAIVGEAEGLMVDSPARTELGNFEPI